MPVMTPTMHNPPHALDGADAAVQWLRARVSGSLHADSRRIAPGDGFVAWPGAVTDGRAHVADALARGAAACLVEQAGVQGFAFPHAQIAALHGLRAAAGPIAAQWFGQPAERLAVLAVTGTNGKTSTAWWIAQALNGLCGRAPAAQKQCALVGTLGLGVAPALEATGLTTPDPFQLQSALSRFAQQGLTACAVEASSIGLADARLDGTRIRTAIFTNFTQDHLDYHGSMAGYWRAKRALFDWPGLRAAVVNVDDPAGARLHAELQGRALDLWSVSARGAARLAARDIAPGAQGLRFTLHEEGAEQQLLLQTHVIGEYNVLNLLGVLATLRSLGVALRDAVAACAQLQPVPGRMQQLALAGQPLVAVDYAHTPDALEKALQALRPLAAGRGGRLWCVFGCGGERDAGKRPLMGAVAQRLADQVLVTSDNPRGEDPAAIVQQILQGTDRGSARVRAETDRAAAIAQAVAGAAPADVLLIAGKGHEDSQEIAGLRRPFSDLAHAQSALQARCAGAGAGR
ncbi:UDP-N-acetylmuramoyl-L-alanyl-D-glutamate--2,6-diaminopimelate ligase [Verminephrobacter aporrectodeae]|uniref:UDP-N-acetylmuramoyl-L-alanyl-D-glutamate--2, 6-diaminopimelate ligase n=1 Tax=Verminephrobacter aporrectodeae TaxID=1110389 RepID=UPI0022383430|nr:UDP-N-acetylmuramoyl-L-alanyl-D-glutamate--2,6-diaminopimelate ligase [Verminephrobacter aporrectodeae]